MKTLFLSTLFIVGAMAESDSCAVRSECENLDPREFVDKQCCDPSVDPCTPEIKEACAQQNKGSCVVGLAECVGCAEGFAVNPNIPNSTDCITDPCNEQLKQNCFNIFKKPCEPGYTECSEECIDTHFLSDGICVQKADCDASACSDGFELDTTPGLKCSSDTCSTDDNDACCAQVCYADICPNATHALKDNYETILCTEGSSPSCDENNIDQCCVLRMTCQEGAESLGLTCDADISTAKNDGSLCVGGQCLSGVDFGNGADTGESCCAATYTTSSEQTFENMAPDDFTEDVKDAFVNSTAESIGVDQDQIQNVNAESTARRMLSSRRLSGNLKVTYDVVLTDVEKAKQVQQTIKDPDSDVADGSALMSKIVERLEEKGADTSVLTKIKSVTANPPVVTRGYKPFCKDEGPCSLKIPGVVPAAVFAENKLNDRCSEDGCSEGVCCRAPIIKKTAFMYAERDGQNNDLCNEKFVKLDVTNFEVQGVVYEGVTVKQICGLHILVEGMPEEQGNIFQLQEDCNRPEKVKWSYSSLSVLNGKRAQKLFCNPYMKSVTARYDIVAYMDMVGEIKFVENGMRLAYGGYTMVQGIIDSGAEFYLVRDTLTQKNYYEHPIILKSNGDLITRYGAMTTDMNGMIVGAEAKIYNNVKKVACAYTLCLFLHTDGTVTHMQLTSGVDSDSGWKDQVGFYSEGTVIDIGCAFHGCWTVRNGATADKVLIHTIATVSTGNKCWAYTENEVPVGTIVMPVARETVCYLSPYNEEDPQSGSVSCPGLPNKGSEWYTTLHQNYAKAPYWNQNTNTYVESIAPSLKYGPHPETGEMVDLWVPEFNNNGFINMVEGGAGTDEEYHLLHKDGWTVRFGTDYTGFVKFCQEKNQCPADFIKEHVQIENGKLKAPSARYLSVSKLAAQMEGENVIHDSVHYFSGVGYEGSSFFSVDYE